MTRRILAIDGGGVRGVIPAVLLAALESATGSRVREQFQFLAGTSTGALIAGAAAAGMPASGIVDLYLQRAPEVFRRTPVISTLRRVVAGHAYEVGDLHRLVRRELERQGAGEWRLNDVPNDIMVTAKGLADGHQWYFVKDRPGQNAGRTGGLRLVDCLTASAAAPTYFQPAKVSGLDDRGPMVDGGTGVAGNPVYQACVEAFTYCSGYQPADTIVVSLGTGQFFDRRRPTWIYSWLEWVLTELLRSPGEQQTELVDRHFGEATFYRIDVVLPRDIPLDDAGRMPELRAIGEQLAARVDWPGILDGRDAEWLVTRRRRAARGYAQEV